MDKAPRAGRPAAAHGRRLHYEGPSGGSWQANGAEARGRKCHDVAQPLSADQFLAVLKKSGVRVVEHGSWRIHNRNHKGAWGSVHGVVVHHDTDGTLHFYGFE
ncbi:hypothetical protein [Streptomyces sp. NBC_00576]|uniref:hypothetical protein n=1 Tax=Streptomyces sp. NBC_00576 TaxID=2903665 RepID=UPI002E8026E9|nr:hypothetical protein [Streptomyces sp. NBC_00576]